MKNYKFHNINMGDVEDPEIYAAMPIYEWQQTDKGKWVMEHCKDPQYRISPSPTTMGYVIDLYGPLEERDAVEFLLKWET